MAQQTIPGGFWFPPFHQQALLPATTALTNGRLNGSTTTRVAFVFQVPKTGTLDKCELWAGTVSAPSDVKISFQDVGTSTGAPDGTADQYRVVASGSLSSGLWVVPGLMTSDGTDGGSKRSVTLGDYLAVVTEWNSTQSGSVFWSCLNRGSAASDAFYAAGSSYLLDYTGGSWVKRGYNGYMQLALKYNDGTYACPDLILPITDVGWNGFTSGSTPDERALYFSFPAPVTVDGGWLILHLYSGATTADVVLYDTNGTTVLATATIDQDILDRVDNSVLVFFRFNTTVALVANGNYRLSFKPGAGSTSYNFEFTAPSAAVMAASVGGGWHLSTRTDAGSWTQTTTVCPWMGLHVSALDDGVSAGGGASSVPFVG